MVVHSGKIGPRYDLNDHAGLFSNRCWVYPPDSPHGWTGVRGEPARISIFHFRFLPRELLRFLNRDRGGSFEVNAETDRRILRLAADARTYWHRPVPGMMLCMHAIQSELSFLIFSALGDQEMIPSNTRNAGVVERALLLFEQELERNLSFREICERLRISQAHLRRCFHQNLDLSPKQAFSQIRHRRVLQMLTDSNCTLEEIAAATGYSETSALSRAFKRQHGLPPGQVRRGI